MMTGCHLDRTSFYMDSNNPLPFLGFQLSQNRNKTQAETPLTVRATTPDATTKTASNSPRLFNNWLNGRKVPERVSLPRTDSPKSEDSVASESVVDETTTALATAQSADFSAEF